MKSSMRLIRRTTDRVWVSPLNWAFAFFESTGCGRNKPSLLQQQQQQSATSYCTAVLHTLTTFQHHDMKTISTTYALVSAYLSVLRHCWLGDRKDIRPVKSCVLVCWWWFDWSFARLIAPVVQLSPPPPSSFASINTGQSRFTWKMAVKTESYSCTDVVTECPWLASTYY